MHHTIRQSVFIPCLLYLLILIPPLHADPADVVTYVGGLKSQRLMAVVQLSDGSALLSGNSSNLDWLPPSVPRTLLDHAAINSAVSGRVAFILHLSPDLQKILRVVHFPLHAVRDIRYIKTSNAPNDRTADVYISGPRINGDPNIDGGKIGYFIAKLNGNFVDHPPTALEWTHNIAASGPHMEDQPWDVGSDGKIYFVAGEPFGDNWAAIYRLNSKGRLDAVENWRFHLTNSGPWHGQSASARPDTQYSAISLSTQKRGSLRSWNQQDYTALLPDGNGATKLGRWPLDAFFPQPFNPLQPNIVSTEPGYTGYTLGPAKTLYVGAIAVDRRTNHFYFSFSVQSKLPYNKLDVEPAVVAMTDAGKLKWWSRLYTESADNSPANQFVDALAVDYSRPPDQSVLVVAARCLGNQKNNLWRGDQVKHPDNPGRAFQSFFDGAADNFFVSWLGRLTLNQGTLLHASYVGEYAEGVTMPGKPYPDPLLDGWQDHDLNLTDIHATRLRPTIHTDSRGRIYVLGTGRRALTTSNAYQKMVKPDQGLSTWTQFVRVYNPDLNSLAYSSILTGAWDPQTGAGGNNTILLGVHPTRHGVLLTGFNTLSRKGVIEGEPIPTQNIPPWGISQPIAEDAIFAKLLFD